eukprot:Lankesteria_metandrocarpae@DN8460_c0_g1_i1.p1
METGKRNIFQFPRHVLAELLYYLPYKQLFRLKELSKGTAQLLDVLSANDSFWKAIVMHSYGTIAFDADEEYVVDDKDNVDCEFVGAWHKNWWCYWHPTTTEVDVYNNRTSGCEDLYAFRPMWRIQACRVLIPGNSQWFSPLVTNKKIKVDKLSDDRIIRCYNEINQHEQHSYTYTFKDIFDAFCWALKVDRYCQERKFICSTEGDYDLYPIIMRVDEVMMRTSEVEDIPSSLKADLTDTAIENMQNGNSDTIVSESENSTDCNLLENCAVGNRVRPTVWFLKAMNAHMEIIKNWKSVQPWVTCRTSPLSRPFFREMFRDPVLSESQYDHIEEEDEELTPSQEVVYKMFNDGSKCIGFWGGVDFMNPCPAVCLREMKGGFFVGMITAGVFT